MFETQTNSNEKKKPKVSKSILPENKKYESKSSIYKVKLPSWLEDNLLKWVACVRGRQETGKLQWQE